MLKSLAQNKVKQRILKLTFASISEVIQLAKRNCSKKSIRTLSKKNILTFNSENGIKLGSAYKTIYKDFVSQTTVDISILIKKWKNSGALEKLLKLENK